MSLSNEQIEHARELFSGVPNITTRKMFGLLGLYSDGVIFALLSSDGTIRLKGVGEMIARYEELGMEKWFYESKGKKPTGVPYWTMPDSAWDDPEEASALAVEALSHLT